MSKSRLARVGAYLAASAAVGFFALGAVVGINDALEREEAFDIEFREVVWTGAQPELELLRFLHALDRYHFAGGEPAREAALERFEVLWSRLPLLQAGTESEPLRRLPWVPEAVEQAAATLAALEPALLELGPGDTAGYVALRDAFEALRPGFHRLFLASLEVSRDAATERHAQGRAARRRLIGNLMGLFVAATTLVGLLAVAVRRAQRARAALARSNAHLTSVLEHAANAILVLDPGGQVALANPRWSALWGVATSGPEQRDALARARALWPADAGPAPFDRHRTGTAEFRFTRADGVAVEGSATELPDGGLLVSAQDVTARERAREEQHRLEIQLQEAQKMESIGLLAGGVAHDFNNLLAVILGRAELALDAGAEAPRHLDAVLRAADRARELVAQLLAFSRGNADAPPTAVAVGPVLREVAQFLRASLPATLTLDVGAAGGVPPVAANPVALHQVLFNLAVNARDAVGARGRLALDASHAEVRGAVCSSCRGAVSGSFVRLTVADDGPGIAPEHLPRIFEPFFSTKAPGKGTGLGLSVVHGLVHRYGGHLEISSEPGRGTTVAVLLPVAAEPEAAAEEVLRCPASAPSGSKTRILVVDDEPEVRSVVSEVLARGGYRVTAAAHGAEAWQRFAEAPDAFALVVTDLTMPGLSGDELAGKILALRPDTPVVVCTGLPTGAPLAGEAARLQKPVSPARLLTAVATALNRRTTSPTPGTGGGREGATP